MQLEGKVAIVYGAGGSMGHAVARAFSGAGAHLFLAGRSRAKLDAVAAGLATDRPPDVDEVDVDDSGPAPGSAPGRNRTGARGLGNPERKRDMQGKMVAERGCAPVCAPAPCEGGQMAGPIEEIETQRPRRGRRRRRSARDYASS